MLQRMLVDPIGSPCHSPTTHWGDSILTIYWIDCQNLWEGSRVHHPPLFGIHYRHGTPNPQGIFNLVFYLTLILKIIIVVNSIILTSLLYLLAQLQGAC